jgi:long-chain acyl-CoA synthetase
MSRVALIGENSIEYISNLLDIWNHGDCAVLLDWRIPFETAYQMMLEAGVQKCCIESRLLKNISLPEYCCVSFSTFNIADNSPHLLPDRVRAKYHENTSDDEAVILYSSGTTGRSKGIILSHYAITTNADAILDYMKLNNSDCLYIAKSLSHSSTLTGELVVSLRSGANVVLAPNVVPPRYVLNRVKEFSITTLCLNPTLLRMFSEECKKKEYDLDSLKTIYCSGAILNDKVYSEAHDILKGVDIFNVYGLSEAGPRVAAQTKECCKSNSVGKAIKDVEVIIVGDDGIPVNNGEYGLIHVNTSSRYSGYVSGKEKHKSLYRNWLNTGDIGNIDEFGELHVTGRVDDVIIIDSHKVYPGDIERLILDNTDVTDCYVSRFTYNGAEMIGCLYVSDKYCTISIMHKWERL